MTASQRKKDVGRSRFLRKDSALAASNPIAHAKLTGIGMQKCRTMTIPAVYASATGTSGACQIDCSAGVGEIGDCGSVAMKYHRVRLRLSEGLDPWRAKRQAGIVTAPASSDASAKTPACRLRGIRGRR